MSNQLKDENLIFPEPVDTVAEIQEHLSGILTSRSGKPADRFITNEPSIDWHAILYVVTPRQLSDAVNRIVDHGKFSVETGDFSNYLIHRFDIGELRIESGTPMFAWNESAATENLLVSFTLNRLYLNHYETLSRAHKDYPSLQILLNKDGTVVIRTYQSLMWGRTVANLMWSIIHFYHDVDRFYRDLVIFD